MARFGAEHEAARAAEADEDAVPDAARVVVAMSSGRRPADSVVIGDIVLADDWRLWNRSPRQVKEGGAGGCVKSRSDFHQALADRVEHGL